MTLDCLKYIEAAAAGLSGHVLEVGSRDLNGSPRGLFSDRQRFQGYAGIDLEAGPGVDYVMDCHALGFPKDYFDVVVDAERLEHDTDFSASYREIFRVLKPGGHVITTARSWGGFHPHCLPQDYWRFLEDGLRHLLTISGFEVIDLRYGDFWKATRNCGETGGCVEHPKGGIHEDIFAHAIYSTARKPGIAQKEGIPFSHDAVLDGHWEFFHDDDCGAALDPITKICSACGWRPDMQSMGARRIKPK